jgi:hypothetical protein
MSQTTIMVFTEESGISITGAVAWLPTDSYKHNEEV